MGEAAPGTEPGTVFVLDHSALEADAQMGARRCECGTGALRCASNRLGIAEWLLANA